MLKHKNTATSDLLHQTADCQTSDGEMLKHKNTATSDLLHQTVNHQTTDGEMVKHQSTATSDVGLLIRQTMEYLPHQTFLSACLTLHVHTHLTLISSLNALVQSAGFSLKTQPRLLLLPTSFHGLTTATSYILSRLDYCNCLLMGIPNSVIQPLQKIQNFAARLVLLAPCHHYSTPLTEKLHWFPISERIKYKSLVCV